MLFSAITTLVLSLSSVASASSSSSDESSSVVQVLQRRYNHRQLSRSLSSSSSAPAPLQKRSRTTRKRNSCSAGSSSSRNSTVTPDTTGDDGDAPSTTTTSSHSQHTSTSTSAGAKATGNAGTPSGGSGAGKLMVIDDPTCGKNNPTSSVTTSNGPNGEEDWFNCGLTSGGGWTPPMVLLSEIVYLTLEEALAKGSTFNACKPHVSMFNTYGKKYGIPPIMLAAFAMQESGCSQDVNNSAGTIGMFQLAPENCKNYGIDCHALDGNIEAACKLINEYLDDAGGNVVEMVGGYNGWSKKMTASKAKSHPCNQQQNLDYLQQFFNAWLQGHDGYSVGTIKNCSGNFGKRKRSLFTPRFARNEEVQELGWHF